MRRTGSKKDEILLMVVMAVAFCVGIAFFALAVVQTKNSVEVMATISSMETTHSSASRSRSRSRRGRGSSSSVNVYVDYEYNGVQYKDKALNYSSSNMYEGKVIKIQVSKDDPGKIYAGKVYIWFGLIFAGIPTMAFIMERKVKKEKEILDEL